MRRECKWKKIKKSMVTVLSMLLIFMLCAPNVMAVGISIDRDANPVAEDGILDSDLNASDEETRDSDTLHEGADKEDLEETDKDNEIAESADALDEQPDLVLEEKESVINPITNLGGGVDSLAGNSNPYTQRMATMLAGESPLRAMAIPTPQTRAAGTFDITAGSLTITQDGYNYAGATGATPEAGYQIIGTTNIHSILVQSGTANITLNDVTCDLATQSNEPALTVSAGATVNLYVSNTVNASSILNGGISSAAIKVEPGGRLFVYGPGALALKGGSGAPAMGGNADSPIGGYVSFQANARVYAYSNSSSTVGAIHMTSVYASKAKILRGNFDVGAVQSTEQEIIVQNRNSNTESYSLTMPANYNSFAVTTTAVGGEYIAYINGKQNDSELLVSSVNTHVFNLLNANENAVLSGLSSKLVKYKITFHANTGFFKEGASSVATVSMELPFNKTISQPSYALEKTNNNPEMTDGTTNWYTASDGTGQWDFANNLLVRDITLYVKWIPENCTVYFKGGYAGAPTLTPSFITIPYNTKLDLGSLPAVSDRSGYKRDGWITEDGVMWDFNKDTVTKETMVLSANWRQECNVIFNENAPAGTVTGMPESPKKYFIGDFLGTIEEPKRSGYAFVGWYTSSKIDLNTSPWDVSNTKLTAATTTFYAGWAIDPCEVVFYTDATGTGVPRSVKYKETITALTDRDVSRPARGEPNPTEYKLEGWYTDAKLTTKWDFDTRLICATTPFNLYAKWRQEDCYVTFKGNGGALEEAGFRDAEIVEKVSYETQVGKPDFQREGYDLVSWTVNDEKGAAWLFDTKVKEDVTLMANWAIKKYQLSFDATGGTPVNGPNMIEYNQPCTSAVVQPRRSGYAFMGWYSDEEYAAGTEWNLATTTMPAKEVTLYAKWEPLEYTVYFDTMGGAQDSLEEQKPLLYTDKVSEPIVSEKMTKEHYTFAGWYTNPDYQGSAWDFEEKRIGDASVYLVEDEESLTGRLTFYAKWEPEIYTVTFHADTEKEDEPEPDLSDEERMQKVEYNTPVSRPNYPEPKWKGHTLLGWYTDLEDDSTRWSFGDDANPILLQGDITLHAKWKCNEYRVGYVVDEEEPTWMDGVVYHYGMQVAKLDDPSEKQYYEFDGWYTNPERRGEKWDFEEDTIATEETDIIFYAKYLGDPRTLNVFLIYEDNNPNYKVPIEQKIAVRYGDKLEIVEIQKEITEHLQKRPGYTLTAWTTDNTGEQFWDFEMDLIGGESLHEETNLYGVWTRDKYTVEFDTDDGDSLESQICEYEWKVTKPSLDPTKTHYQFDGWFKEKELENAWDFEEDLIYGNTTLYAKWKPNVYQLRFETNGGSKLDSIDVEYGTTIPEAALETTKEGYFVSGWYRDAALTQSFDVKKDLVDANNTTLYAKWSLNNYTVTYHVTDMQTAEVFTEVDSKVYHVGDKLTKVDYPREHKTMSIWYQDAGFKEKWLFKRDTVKGDTTIYAFWSPTLYKVRFETYGGTVYDELNLEWGSQFADPGPANKAGYTFTGWYADANFTTLWNFEEDFVDGDTVVYAGWSINSYTVSFDGDGGGPVPDSMVFPFGSLVPHPEDPAKDGFVFAGWKSDIQPSAQSEVKLAANADGTWNFDVDTVPGDMILTAQWKTVESENAGGNDTNMPQQNMENDGNNANTGSDTVSKALDQLTSAVDNVAKILTGDDAPLLWAIVGVMLSAAGIGWLAVRKMRKK